MKHFIVLSLCVLLAGCVTTPKVDWDARINAFTYDQAVLELGPPEKSATLTDGSRVADWLTIRGQRNVTFHSFPDGRVMRLEGGRDPDRLLRLTFGPDGKLKEWKRLWR
ncbi:MAG: hypothetical protein EB141_09345 [Verrucomicrobia bacterium]|nr:hypothetical protein [Verrucomicrobiota bacterium]NBU09316.1 hypothetical protein [Pseudomonadota bacterium]NDB75831.1 hypothetical protein [Verrucomicrobiota bacterium]